jgi:hypothetical protein
MRTLLGGLMRRLFLAALFLSVAAFTLPHLIEIGRRAASLAPLTREQRRDRILGDFYRAAVRLRSTVPANEPIAIVARDWVESSDAMFLIGELYPHAARIYPTRASYAVADPSRRPRVLVSVRGAPHVTTYAAIRAEDLSGTPIVRDMRLPADARREFIIPIAISLDGVPPAAYVVEGLLESEGEAHVILTLQPAGVARTLTIRGRHTFYDLVYQCFGRMDIGWIAVTSDAPIRAAFWFVNRGARSAEPIRLVAAPLAAPTRFPSLPRSKLWLINFSETPALVRVDARQIVVGPRALLSTESGSVVRGPVYAFLSFEDADRITRFKWPEDIR